MNGHASVHTPTALKRWSCQDQELPPVDHIQRIHIYDFDNTLFASPLPNKQIWNMTTFGSLQAQDFLHNGGWWHNPNILAATGRGVEAEEARAWDGFWNETVVQCAQLSAQEPETLSVLLTGRSEASFAHLVKRMLASKGLRFDMVCLKPAVGPSGDVFSSTLIFKQALLRDIIYTYPRASEIRVYDDRPKHVKAFRDYFFDLNKTMSSTLDSPRDPIEAEVIQISEQETAMEPATEVAEVQRMINIHNQAILDGTAPRKAVPYKIKRSVFYTGYIIQQDDSERLKPLVKLPPGIPEQEVKYLANNILICPRPPPPSILDRVGGIGAKMRWRVTGLGHFEQRVWAARVEPVPRTAQIYTENKTPQVVLATRRNSKPIEATRIMNWQPVPGGEFEFDTVVGEKVLLRIEEEVAGEDSYEASFPNAKNARKHPREDEFPPLGSQGRLKPQQRPQQNGAWGNRGGGYASQRGGGNAGRGGGGGGGGRGGGRGGFQPRRGAPRGGGAGGNRGRVGYRSLDDSARSGYDTGGMEY
ncbi:hypothetical protein Tdes44962_MAKER02271 [Teratosphaeria destructans]|uniref:Swiss Army Knife RNA repair protein HAD domain-containing protein n=1 Tax=Teratosphaeria destructans TaxID=418781 RepID=A0A9W7SUV0_9PEZI|nr:hypothetical protein Tdes44962_MAKER02271 [Teratosphaeria destructans]